MSDLECQSERILLRPRITIDRCRGEVSRDGDFCFNREMLPVAAISHLLLPPSIFKVDGDDVIK